MEQITKEEISSLRQEKLAVEACLEGLHESMAEGSLIYAGMGCPRCGGDQGQWRGYRERKHGGSVHRRCCTSCGRWFGVWQ